jgi:hypothetical protein
MNKPLKIIRLFDEIYYKNLIFLVGDIKEAEKFINRKFKTSFKFEPCAGKSIDFLKSRQTIIIYLEKYKETPDSISILAHECLHAGIFVMEYIGMETNDKNSEALCYLVDSLVRRFLKQFYKKN